MSSFLKIFIVCSEFLSIVSPERAGRVLFLYNILISRLTARRPLEIVRRKIIQIFGFSLTEIERSEGSEVSLREQ